MDPITLVMLAVLVVLVIFMFRNGRKRKADQEALQATMVPGAQVMTNFGMYGTIMSIDEVANKVALEIAPGTVVELHRQTIARVVEPVVAGDGAAGEPGELELNESHGTVMGDPEFGLRLDKNPEAEPKKGDE